MISSTRWLRVARAFVVGVAVLTGCGDEDSPPPIRKADAGVDAAGGGAGSGGRGGSAGAAGSGAGVGGKAGSAGSGGTAGASGGGGGAAGSAGGAGGAGGTTAGAAGTTAGGGGSDDGGGGSAGGVADSGAEIDVATQKPELVAYYKFDETSGTVAADSSGQNHTAILSGQASFSGGTLFCNDMATSFATLPVGILLGTADFTVATSVNLEDRDGWSRIFDFGTNSSSSYMFLTPANGSNGNVRFGITITGGGAGEQLVDGPTPLPLHAWTHVAVRLFGNTATLWIDGAIAGTNANMTLSATNLGASPNNWIGKSQFPDPPLNGRVDEFRVYKGALTDAEIIALSMIGPSLVDAGAPDAGSDTGTTSDASDAGTTSDDASDAPDTSVTSDASDASVTSDASDAGVDAPDDISVTSDAADAATSNDAADANDEPDTSDASGDGDGDTLASGLLVHYPFESASPTIVDTSGNHLDAQTAFAWIAGQTGNAVSLEGAFGHVTLPTTGITDGLNDFSVSVWVKPARLADWMRIFDFGTGTNQYVMVTASAGGTGRPRFSLKNGDPEQIVDSSVALTVGVWQNLVVTQSGDMVTMFLNGAMVGTNAAVTRRASAFSANQNWLGRAQFNDPRFEGALDDFRLYTRVLTTEEIAALSGGDAGALSSTGLRVGYAFDETDGTSVADFSGNSMAGSVGGLASGAGQVGQAVTLDGIQGYARLPANVVSGVGDFTVAAWVKQATLLNWSRIFDFGNDTGTYMMLTANSGASQTLRFSLRVNGGGEEIVDGPALPVGTWQHVAVARAGNTVTIYVNGAAAGSGPVNGTLPNTANNFIGRSQYPDPLFSGSLDDFRIYTRALGTGEIAALATAKDGG